MGTHETQKVMWKRDEDDAAICPHSYLARIAEYKLGAIYRATNSHADLVRPTTK